MNYTHFIQNKRSVIRPSGFSIPRQSIAQPYIPPTGDPPTKEQRHFARWVNMKAEFNSRTWEEYAKDKLVTA